MDDQQQSRRRLTRRQMLWAAGIATLVFLIIVISGYLFGWKWTGLPKKTLWDWLNLLIVPAVLALGGYFFTRSENRRMLEVAERQRAADREIADQRRQDDALQAYLDDIGELLLNQDTPLRQAQEGAEVRRLARARTLTVLRRLDGERKGRVLEFVSESGLIDKRAAVLDLEGADLSQASLRSKAWLVVAYLREADLSEASLREAWLMRADLSGADLSGADLSEADLSEASLRGADLGGADLTEASLGGAKGWTAEQLNQARSLEGATMPNGQKYKDWREGRKDGS